VGALQNFGGSFAPIVTGYMHQYTNSLNNAFVASPISGVPMPNWWLNAELRSKLVFGEAGI
jgi:hypothetical protein